MHVFFPVLTHLSREVHPLLSSFSAFDCPFIFCYWQQPPALPRNLLPSVSCSLQPSLTTAVPYGPGRFHNSLSFSHECFVCINSSLFCTFLHLCVATSSESAIAAPISAPHHCSLFLYPITAPYLCIPLLRVLASSPLTFWLCPEKWWRPPNPPPPTPSKANPFCKPMYTMLSHSLERTGTNVPNSHVQTHLSQDRRFSPLRAGGSLHPCDKGISGINVPGCFQRGFPCHLVDKGGIFPFSFHGRRRSPWESPVLVGNPAEHPPI